MISAERNVVNIQRCCRVNYCSDSSDIIDDEMKESDNFNETEVFERPGSAEACKYFN